MPDNVNFAYRESEALTEDPVGLVVVLYDMLLKDLHDAITALSCSDIERRAAAIRHSMLVLQQLQSTLDMENGGVVAANLDRFYNFTRAKLLEGQIKASAEIFEQQVLLVGSIREAWEQIRAEKSPQPSAPETTLGPLPPVDVTGSANQWSA